ncbi:MAG: DNA-directed RNA polymerase III subunit rpc25 [Chrysothrix sp. TS-e1954]|nr:MAG: DNA-directed RNA polymerase III subunit rpc25 [Chrysothrix sp. TS-e1954]
MFLLSTLSDTIPLHPTTFTHPTLTALTDALNARYANKVIPHLGVCLSLYDIQKTSSGLINPTITTSPLDAPNAAPGSGIAHVNATFRLLIFRAFRGEILEGVIGDSDDAGLAINLEFFQDIRVNAPDGLFRGQGDKARWDAREKVWIWRTGGDDFFFDKHERVRCRVEEEVWVDVPPGRAEARRGGEEEDEGFEAALKAGDGRGEVGTGEASYRLVARMDQPGLGQLSWWSDD